MADQYKTVAGFVQFDPNERESNGKTLQDALIQNVSQNIDVRVTIWPELGVKVKKGDFIAASGKYSERDTNGRTYRNLSAKNIVVLAGTEAAKTVVNSLDKPATVDDPGF